MEVHPRNVENYVAPDDTCPFDEWMDKLKDLKGKAQIEARINKLRRGMLGDCRSVGEGIIELRIDFGPGYRVYCVDDGTNALILWAGTKRTQGADIRRAKLYWREYNS
jgi:putative addiction module killer protein